MVDSKPRSVGPASMINGMRPPSDFATCSARVGLIEPLIATGPNRTRVVVSHDRDAATAEADAVLELR